MVPKRWPQRCALITGPVGAGGPGRGSALGKAAKNGSEGGTAARAPG